MTVFNELSKGTKAILIVQSVAMLMGTYTHVSWVVHNGFLSENYNAPFWNMMFWDGLTFLDPLAAILLLVRPKMGLILTAFIIFADVIHNNFFYLDELYFQGIGFTDWIEKYWMIFGHMVFALFVVLTLRRCLKKISTITILTKQ